eukprot:969665-Amphidinium_carterae.3
MCLWVWQTGTGHFGTASVISDHSSPGRGSHGSALRLLRGLGNCSQDRIPIARRRCVYKLTTRLVPSGCLLPATMALGAPEVQEELDPLIWVRRAHRA